MKAKTMMALFLFLFSFPAAAQADRQHLKDSLRAAIPLATGVEKIRTYSQLANVYFPESGDDLKMDTMLTIFAQMDAEAKRQGNIVQQGVVRGNILMAYQNRSEYGEIIRRAPEYLEELSKPDGWKYYYHCYTSLIRAYLYQGDLPAAIRTAQQMYDQAAAMESKEGMGMALYALAEIYDTQDRYDDKEKMLRQCIETLKNDKELFSLSAKTWYDLCMSMLSRGQYDKLPEALAAFGAANERYEAFMGMAVPTTRGNLWGIYALMYAQTGEYDLAEEYCNKVDSVITGIRYQQITSSARAIILNGQGRYAEALEQADRALTLDDEYTTSANTKRALKMEILANMGRYREAYELHQEYHAIGDSLRNTKFAQQVDALRTEYDLDRLEAEKERHQLQLTWSVVACAFLLLLFGGYVIFSRRLHAKNLAIYKSLSQASEGRDDAQTPSLVERGPGGEVTGGEAGELFHRLTSLLCTGNLFTHADIDRRSLADRLGTNEKYLTNAVRDSGWDSLPAYLSSLRLGYALAQLNSDPSKSLQALATESGHGSYTAFYRAFSHYYGITPSEYRKMQRRTSP